jgi:carbonic anhydrase/acetyltransferase-like protein (isoleucine patch superfamily)
VEGSFLGPFSTVDLTTAHDCVVGNFSYIQVGEMSHLQIDPGTVWIRSDDRFNFLYRFKPEVLERYINFEPGKEPQGIFMEFVEDRKEDFQRIFDVVNLEPPEFVPPSASLNRYAVVKRKTQINENVLVSQRAYLENSWLGKGANAQENCYIINSRLEGNNVTAHGAKIIHAQLGKNVFVGFNSFLSGKADGSLEIGADSIVMPHTIIDIEEPLTIPAGHIVWGYIRNKNDLAQNSLSLDSFSRINDRCIQGSMLFEGSGAEFVKAFKERIDHILEANGAYFDGQNNRGHAQKSQNISFNTIQPYPEGDLEGIYPTIDIHP